MSINKATLSYDDLLRKSKEQELEINRLVAKEASLSSFNLIKEKSDNLEYSFGMDTFFKEINHDFLEILGYSKEESTNKILRSLIHSEDIELLAQEIRSLSKSNPIINFDLLLQLYQLLKIVPQTKSFFY